ncbi:MAG TPA: right-handed parallel beta-helix repeat-containing protein [Solimonas sp.]|nr:right-handed parallel beta-helix repeat-containing protein [Solimonas sp.]
MTSVTPSPVVPVQMLRLALGSDVLSAAQTVANAAFSVDTHAALRELAPALPAGRTIVVHTLGRDAADDGIGGPYRWQSNSDVADDGGRVIKPNSVAGAGRWVRADDKCSALLYGADSTGTSDATARLNALFAAAQRDRLAAEIEAGTFVVDAAMDETAALEFRDGVKVYGHGIGKSVLKRAASGTSNADIARCEGDAGAAINTIVCQLIHVEDLTFDANNVAQRAFYPRSVGRLIIERCDFANTKRPGGGHGMRALWCTDVTVRSSRGYECSDNGISVEVSDRATIDDCSGYANGEMGLTLNSVIDGTIVNSRAWANAKTGITIESGGVGADGRGRKMTAINNRSYNNAEHGFICGTSAAKELIFGFNHALDNAQIGVFASSLDAENKTEKISISACIISRNGYEGIKLQSPAGTSFADKLIISGVDASDNSKSAENAYSNLKANSVNITSLIVSGCNLSANGVGNKAKYGAELGGPIAALTFTGNEAIGLGTAPHDFGQATATTLIAAGNNYGMAVLDLAGSATPIVEVDLPCYTIGNATPVTVTNFIGGWVGRTIRIRCTNGGNTTLQDGANIKLSGGGSFVMAFGATITLTMYATGVWTEDARHA